jgi:hypothetical protein
MSSNCRMRKKLAAWRMTLGPELVWKNGPKKVRVLCGAKVVGAKHAGFFDESRSLGVERKKAG